MIRSFRHKGLRLLFEGESTKGVQAAYARKMRHILLQLDAATSPQGMNVPGYRLHPLAGDMDGLWSVRVSANWRIVFRFEGTSACDVDLIDYH